MEGEGRANFRRHLRRGLSGLFRLLQLLLQLLLLLDQLPEAQVGLVRLVPRFALLSAGLALAVCPSEVCSYTQGGLGSSEPLPEQGNIAEDSSISLCPQLSILLLADQGAGDGQGTKLLPSKSTFRWLACTSLGCKASSCCTLAVRS